MLPPDAHANDSWRTKRDSALQLLRVCEEVLPTVRQTDDARAFVRDMWGRIERLQGGPDNRPHLLKTLCRFVHALRISGWAALAIPLIEAARQGGTLDAYVLTELTECQLALGDPAAAERTLDAACTTRVDTAAIYTSLLTAYGRAGDWQRAERLYSTALKTGVHSEFVFTAMIVAYARSGRMGAAQVTLDAARCRGATSEMSFTALITAFGRTGRPREAQRVFDQAQTHGMAHARAYTSLMRAYAAAGSFWHARRVLEEATANGCADDHMYFEFLAACVGARRIREAAIVLKRARADGRDLGVTRRTLVVRMGPQLRRWRATPGSDAQRLGPAAPAR